MKRREAATGTGLVRKASRATTQGVGRPFLSHFDAFCLSYVKIPLRTSLSFRDAEKRKFEQEVLPVGRMGKQLDFFGTIWVVGLSKTLSTLSNSWSYGIPDMAHGLQTCAARVRGVLTVSAGWCGSQF